MNVRISAFFQLKIIIFELNVKSIDFHFHALLICSHVFKSILHSKCDRLYKESHDLTFDQSPRNLNDFCFYFTTFQILKRLVSRISGKRSVPDLLSRFRTPLAALSGWEMVLSPRMHLCTGRSACSSNSSRISNVMCAGMQTLPLRSDFPEK